MCLWKVGVEGWGGDVDVDVRLFTNGGRMEM